MFVLKDDRSLVEMKPAEFDSEDDFQALVESYPELLCGAQIDSNCPRKWILVKREMPIASEEGGGGRFSLDHLFLDQDGIPTLVEVKRKDDTRLRREVVGQLLDYAANGVAYWPVDTLRELVEQQHNEDALLALLGDPEADLKQFWERVKTNLQAGKVRMLFLADYIPPELRRVVEFLNVQMDPAEVLALELKLFKSESGLRTLVPRLYGQTEEAQQKKAGATGQNRTWNEDSIYSDMEQRCGAVSVAIAKKIADWMKERSDKYLFGLGKVYGSISAIFICGKDRFNPFQFNSAGVLWLNFGYCKKGLFANPEKRLEWLRLLNTNCDLGIPDNTIDGFVSKPLTTFKDEKRLDGLLKTMDWFARELHHPASE